MAITKTKNIGLTKDDKTEHYSVDRVNANSDKIDEEFGSVKTTIGNVKDTNLQGYDESRYGTKSVANFLKFIWGNLGSIELTDKKVKVTTWQDNTLDKVLEKIKGWIGDLSRLNTQEKGSLVGAVNENKLKIDDVKANSEEYDKILNNQLVSINNKITSNNAEFDRLNRQFRQLNGGE